MYYLHEAPVNSQIYVMDILVLFIYLKFISYNLFSKMLHTEKRRHSRIIKLYDIQNKNIQKQLVTVPKQRNSHCLVQRRGHMKDFN